MIIHGDCLEEMRKMEPNSISAVVTDPPYGLHFMGKGWDSFAKGKVKCGRKVLGTHTNSEAHEAARYDERRNDEFQSFIERFGVEALRIVKPGGHILIFGAPRRHHRQVCGLEDAGWEIRDCIMWIFGSGFPKSHNHFGIEGFGTALKPAYEPIIMAMKPCDGTFKQNAEKWGQAGINIDGCRIGTEERFNPPTMKGKTAALVSFENCNGTGSTVKGRWPANVILDEESAQMLDEQSGTLKTGGGDKGNKTQDGGYGKKYGYLERISLPSSGGASRFFYCAKASSNERGEGNGHPTVKPLKLMEYLIKLVMPPKDGILLDPFAGSGTTILAARRLGFTAIGIEKEQSYCEIARARIAQVQAQK